MGLERWDGLYPTEMIEDIYDKFVTGTCRLFIIRPPKFLETLSPALSSIVDTAIGGGKERIDKYVEKKYPNIYYCITDREEFFIELDKMILKQSNERKSVTPKGEDISIRITEVEKEIQRNNKPIEDIKYLRKRVKYAKTPMERREYQQKLDIALKTKKKNTSTPKGRE